MRILAADYGDARTGLAVCDSNETIASPIGNAEGKGLFAVASSTAAKALERGAGMIVVGLPVNMDGTEGFQAQKVRDFCRQLEIAGLNVAFQDERLSTVTAENALIEGGMSRDGRKQNVDKVAAAVILQQWLDNKQQEG